MKPQSWLGRSWHPCGGAVSTVHYGQARGFGANLPDFTQAVAQPSGPRPRPNRPGGGQDPQYIREEQSVSRQRNAFVLRIAPSGVDRVEEALGADQLIIGWPQASELLDPRLGWEEFREVLRRAYYAEDENLRRAGAAAGHMWRFIREMESGDLVVTPHGPEFYVGEVTGAASHSPDLIDDDTAFRRGVRWLNGKKAIPRAQARAALQSRMKTQGTCAYATDLVEQIEECLRLGERGEVRSFEGDLKRRLAEETLEEIRSGRLDSFGFENLLSSLLLGMGAEESRVVPRVQDKGADILATFTIAGAFRFVVAVQAKHYQPEPPVGADTVRQLTAGLEAESANLGMVVTSGSFSEEAVAAAEAYFEEKGIKIELVDGPQLASLIVEQGLGANLGAGRGED